MFAGRFWGGEVALLRSSARAAIGAVVGLLVTGPGLSAEHIVSAQEGLGAGWWGLVLLGGVAISFVGGIAATIFRIAREEERRAPQPGPTGG